jgi:hypothetical protein
VAGYHAGLPAPSCGNRVRERETNTERGHSRGNRFEFFDFFSELLVRKFILIDVTQESPATMLGLAASVLALGAVYWLVREQDQREAEADADGPSGG